MNIQIFGNKKSFDSKKAERWFKERRIKYQYIDLPRYGMSAGEYRSVKQKLGFDALVDTQCAAYEALYMPIPMLKGISRAVSHPHCAQWKRLHRGLLSRAMGRLAGG